MIDDAPCCAASTSAAADCSSAGSATAILDSGRNVRASLATLRRYAKCRHDATLSKARELLAHGRSPEQALEFLAHTLMNRLLHSPFANIRAAALRGDVDLLRQAEQLFCLPTPGGSGR